MLTSHDHFVSFDFPSFFLAEGVIYYEMLQTRLFFPLFLKATQESSLGPSTITNLVKPSIYLFESTSLPSVEGNFSHFIQLGC